jgi:hypothetical protein
MELIIDRQNKEKMAFTSKGKQVRVGNEFLGALAMLGVDYSVN